MVKDSIKFESSWYFMAQAWKPMEQQAFYNTLFRYAFQHTDTHRESLPQKMWPLFELAAKSITSTRNRSLGHLKQREKIERKSEDNPENFAGLSQDNREIIARNKDVVFSLHSLSSINSKIKQETSEEAIEDTKAHTSGAHALRGDQGQDLDGGSAGLRSGTDKTNSANKSDEYEHLMPEHLKGDPEFRAEWLEWLKYRKKHRKAVSQPGAARQLKLLGDYSAADAIRIIETSITNDYQGLFPCKVNNIKPRRDYTGI